MIKNIILANLAVLLVPGVNFILITNTALKKGLKASCSISFGSTLSIMIHVFLAIILVDKIVFTSRIEFIVPIATIISSSIIILMGVLIGYKALILESSTSVSKFGDEKKKNLYHKMTLSDNYFLQGALLDIFNPMICSFYVSIFSQNLKKETPLSEIMMTSCVIFLITISWFLLVGCLFSRKNLHKIYMKYEKNIGFLVSFILIFIGYRGFMSI